MSLIRKWKKNPTYMHLFGTIRLLIFIKKSHLYVYSNLYFIHFCQIHYVSYWHMKQKKGFWGLLRVTFIMYGSKRDNKLSLYFLYVCIYSNHVTIIIFWSNWPTYTFIHFPEKFPHMYMFIQSYIFISFPENFPSMHIFKFGTVVYSEL